MNDSIYRFEHAWRIGSEKEKLWALISDFKYENWWPNVSIERIATGDAGDGRGHTYASVFRTRLLYSLKLNAAVVDSRPPNAIVLRVTGHLEGRAVIRLHAVGGETELHCLMELETTRRWMSALAPLLRPVFIRNHRQLMEDGMAGLSAYLAANVAPGSVRTPYRRPARGLESAGHGRHP
ncbi:SRPBCC family protein [Cohnella sp. JJ-181]|uniref:SRPBCC family protein n=1 Tax=Cohnella rhizoplanae TaxID=2974897 RepID=UPI0022FF8DE4|nr:SRPBCC family protein [Cohnella sp. JJ-181]CAI6076458.1 hypothetical protein COHCIP112018_02524 [Cohnella sp. JJ-181]